MALTIIKTDADPGRDTAEAKARRRRIDALTVDRSPSKRLTLPDPDPYGLQAEEWLRAWQARHVMTRLEAMRQLLRKTAKTMPTREPLAIRPDGRR